MRFLYSLLMLLFANTAFAQNYSVQQAPNHWGNPQGAPIQETRPDPIYVGPEPVDVIEGTNAAANNSSTFDEALNCASYLQISNLAAPQWSKQAGVIAASNLWLGRVFTLGESEGKTGDKISDLVKTRMENIVSNNDNAGELAQKAFECASNPPQ